MPTPYYDDGQVTIYCGDWRDCLPVLCPSDVVVTDPPYGTGGWRRSESGRGDDPTASLVVEDWDDGVVDWLDRCREAAGVLAFYPSARTLGLLRRASDLGLTKHRAVYLQKPDPKPMLGGRISWSVEPVWVLSRDGFVLYGKSDWHVASVPRANRDLEAVGHPYQKPLSAMHWLIGMTKDQRVIDLFMGSGSTVVAARNMGRRAIGVEIEERYCEIAVRRLAQQVLPLTG